MRQMSSFTIRRTCVLALVLLCFIGINQAQAFIPDEVLTEVMMPATIELPVQDGSSVRALLGTNEDVFVASIPVTPTRQPTEPASQQKAQPGSVPLGSGSGDVYFWLREASGRYGLSYSYLLSIATCESRLSRTARKGSHIGIFQQASGYWRERVGQYNQHNAVKVSGDIYSVRDNVLVSAWMLSGNPSARKYHYGPQHWVCRGSRR